MTKINLTGSSFSYSTFLGGTSSDFGRGIAVDRWNSTYVTGYTSSNDFPTHKAFNPFHSGRDDVFVAKFNAEGTPLIYATYFGGLNGSLLFKSKSRTP